MGEGPGRFLGHLVVRVCPYVIVSLSRSMTKPTKCPVRPAKETDQPGHPPSLIRVFTVRSMGSYGLNLSSCEQRKL